MVESWSVFQDVDAARSAILFFAFVTRFLESKFASPNLRARANSYGSWWMRCMVAHDEGEEVHAVLRYWTSISSANEIHDIDQVSLQPIGARDSRCHCRTGPVSLQPMRFTIPLSYWTSISSAYEIHDTSAILDQYLFSNEIHDTTVVPDQYLFSQ